LKGLLEPGSKKHHNNNEKIEGKLRVLERGHDVSKEKQKEEKKKRIKDQKIRGALARSLE